jgi:hypothetical protein
MNMQNQKAAPQDEFTNLGVIASHLSAVIASEATQSHNYARDCFVAMLLAMTKEKRRDFFGHEGILPFKLYAEERDSSDLTDRNGKGENKSILWESDYYSPRHCPRLL